MGMIDKMFPGTYLKAGEYDERGTVHTISECRQEEVGTDKELKWVVYFHDAGKGLVLNKSNAEALLDMLGEDLDAWSGKKVEVYHDANVSYGGKRVGGLRVRKALPAAATSGDGQAEAPF